MQGDLTEFSLSELLQLFALSEKSGIVTISTDGQDTRLFIEAGTITGWGLDDFDAHTAILGCRFLPPATESAVRSISPEPEAPGLSFVVRNLVEPQRWASFVQRVLEQDVYRVLDLDDGYFDIVVDRIPPVPLSLNLSVQQLILDGSRWDAARQELDSEGYGASTTWSRVRAAAGEAEHEISPPEWLVLAALTERHAIGAVAADVCLPDLDTSKAVRNLHRRGLIEPFPAGD